MTVCFGKNMEFMDFVTIIIGLIERLMELLLKNPDIDIHYCISWDNETWFRTWSGKRNFNTTTIWK